MNSPVEAQQLAESIEFEKQKKNKCNSLSCSRRNSMVSLLVRKRSKSLDSRSKYYQGIHNCANNTLSSSFTSETSASFTSSLLLQDLSNCSLNISGRKSFVSSPLSLNDIDWEANFNDIQLVSR